MKHPPRFVLATSSSKDGQWLLCPGCTGLATLWDIQQDRSREVRTYALGRIIASIDPSGRWIATSFNDGGIRIKDLKGVGDESIVINGEAGSMFAPVAVSFTGRWIATVTREEEVQLRDTHANTDEEFSRLLPDAAKLVGFSADERFLVTAGPDTTVSVWDLAADDVQGSRRSFGRGAATITSDSRWLITGGDSDGDIQTWDLQSPDSNPALPSLAGHIGPIQKMVVSADGRWLATQGPAGDSGKLMLWDLANRSRAGVVLVEDATLHRLSISSDSRWLAATIGTDVGVWDLTKGDLAQPQRILQGDGTYIWRLEISRNGRWVFTSRGDATAQLWDLSRKISQPIDLPTPGVQGSAISPDGRWLAMCKQGPTMQFFDLHAEDPPNTRRVLYCPGDIMWNLAISGDSRWLVSASSEGAVRRWCLDTDWALDYAKRMTRRKLRPEERRWYGVDD